jgi:hypothetical protein
MLRIGGIVAQEPYRSYQPGEQVFVRAIVLEHCSTASRGGVGIVRFEDYPNFTITAYAPVSEIARAEEIPLLPPLRRPDMAVEKAERAALPSAVNSPATSIA